MKNKLSSTEYYLEAVRAWQQANKNLKHFARCCYHVSNRETQALAADCGCSVDTIEKYRMAYSLYTELETSAQGGFLWDSANISLWVKAAQLRQRLDIPLDTVHEYLETAIDHNMTRESFAAHVDGKENKTPIWIRRLRNAIKVLSPSKQDFKSEMRPDLRERYDTAVERFSSELQAIIRESEKESI
jgi:hypothetical protein